MKIKRAKEGKNVGHVVGHDSTDFARSDSSNLIAKRMVRVFRGKFLIKNVLPLFETQLLIES